MRNSRGRSRPSTRWQDRASVGVDRASVGEDKASVGKRLTFYPPQTVSVDLAGRHAGGDQRGVYLTASVHKVVVQKSILAQIRQLILYISNNKG